MILKREQFLALIDEAKFASINQFCKAANLNPGTVSKVLAGKTPPGVRFIAAASYTLNAPVETFIEIQES